MSLDPTSEIKDAFAARPDDLAEEATHAGAATPAGQPLDLSGGSAVFFFSAPALRFSSDVNLYRGAEIAFHIKYAALRGGFVLNDRKDNVWGQEIFVEALVPAGSHGMLVTLTLNTDGPQLTFASGANFRLGERFNLSGALRVVAPDVVPTGEAACRASDQRQGIPTTVRMVENGGGGLNVATDIAILSSVGFFLEGWADDRSLPLAGMTAVDLFGAAASALPVYRVRRPDVDEALKPGAPYEFGFWTAGLATEYTNLQELALSVVGQDGTGVQVEFADQRRMSSREFFEFLLIHFGRRALLDNRVARSFADLDAGYGEVLSEVHRRVASTRSVDYEVKFGTAGRNPKISLVCVLHGIPDLLYLLVSQFGRFGSLDMVEFVFVGNSPELAEVLIRDAELASFVFGANVKLILLNQNTGFSYANNIGVSAATARRIAIVNPDVFPRNAEAFAHLLRLAEQGFGNNLVGGKLHYSDGSVMHEGMYFEQDRKLSTLCRAPVWTVEHFRKGFADTASLEVRPVPAVTGALMLIERDLFESMQGFDTNFIYGHYEDADLCLRIRRAGGRVLLDPGLAYWHYEGMGSVKRPEQAGSALYNRWRFSQAWGERLGDANHA